MRKSSGFTIAELMITVAIISILSAIAFRPFGAFYASQKLKYAAIELAGYLRTSRAIALKDGGVCQIERITATPVIFGPSSLAGNKCTSANSPNINLATLSGLDNLSASSATVSFVRHGFMAGSSSTIRIKSTGTTTEWCINILSPSALVRVGHAEGSTADCDYVSG